MSRGYEDIRKMIAAAERSDMIFQASIDGESGATSQWDGDKGIPIEVEHADPTVQALIDFKEKNCY